MEYVRTAVTTIKSLLEQHELGGIATVSSTENGQIRIHMAVPGNEELYRSHQANLDKLYSHILSSCKLTSATAPVKKSKHTTEIATFPGEPKIRITSFETTITIPFNQGLNDNLMQMLTKNPEAQTSSFAPRMCAS